MSISANDPNARHSPDDQRLAHLLALTAVVTGVGTIVLKASGGYGDPAAGAQYQGAGASIVPLYAALWIAHVAGYLISARVPRGFVPGLAYLSFQTAMVVGLILTSGRAVASLVFVVALSANAVALFPRRWPVSVALGALLALTVMSSAPSQAGQLLVLVTALTMFVMTTYMINFVRGALGRREARELLADLEATQTELAGYASDVEELALANERQRLARELHDTLAQGLVGVTLQLEAADAHLAKGGSNRAREIVTQAMVRARDTLADARKAIHDLRSPSDDHVALGFAIRREVDRFSSATGISCDTAIDVLPNVDPILSDHLKKVVTEGLINVARHARASRVTLSVSATNGSIEVVLHDDGVGLDRSNGDGQDGHYGILGLRERARTVGGAARVENSQDGGTTLRFSAPLQTDAVGPDSRDE